jgi:TRAP-type C4-dicarboxylate transport system substrate-binding protein
MLNRKGPTPARRAIAAGPFAMVRLIVASCLLSCVWVADALAYSGPEMTLRFATIKNRQLSQGQQWNHFAELVNQATGGKVKVQVFYDGTLFGERTAVEAVLNGSIDIGTSANPQYAPWTDAMLWMDMPYVVDDQAGLRKLLDSAPGETIRSSMEQKPGLKVLMMIDNGGGRPVLTVSKQVKVPADLKGMKVRSVASPVDQAIWRSWGASPTPIDFAEVYSALQSKVVDGYGPNWSDAIGTKQVEQIKYAADINYIVGTQLAVMRLDKFNALPKELRDVLLKAGRDTERWGIKVDADEVAQMQGIFKDKYGVVIYKPAPPELEQWKSLARAVWTQFPGRVSEEKLKELQKLSGSK